MAPTAASTSFIQSSKLFRAILPHLHRPFHRQYCMVRPMIYSLLYRASDNPGVPQARALGHVLDMDDAAPVLVPGRDTAARAPDEAAAVAPAVIHGPGSTMPTSMPARSAR